MTVWMSKRIMWMVNKMRRMKRPNMMVWIEKKIQRIKRLNMMVGCQSGLCGLQRRFGE